MTYEEDVRAILETNFAGFKEQIIDIAAKKIMALEQQSRFLMHSDGSIEQIEQSNSNEDCKCDERKKGNCPFIQRGRGMTNEEIISGLKFTVEMCLFDTNTGEKYTEPRNDMDKITIDACKGAIKVLEQEPVLDKIKGYIDHIRNTGMGKKKSLKFIEKFIEGLKGRK